MAAGVPILTESGMKLSALNPKYLHTNSTSHTWPFSAIAELVDNAYDPDCKASQLRIEVKDYIYNGNNKTSAMIFSDNGSGMTPDKLYKMMSFGFCEKDKVNIKNHMPVGHYGNGFKSGSMRLGKDALVLTKCATSKSIGYLSQTYLKEVAAETIVIPMVTWDRQTGSLVDKKEEEVSLPVILQHSVLDKTEKIINEFKKISSKNGTRIIITKLRQTKEEGSEFDFSVKDDIRIPEDIEGSEGSKYKREERQQHIPASDYSLRAYLSILYLKPKMQIFLRGSKVKTVVIAKSLSNTEVDVYKPVNKKAVKITFGFSRNENHYGIMMYHRNRLIKPYVRVGCQLRANNMGVGVIGVIECDSLQPTHNKQDFDYTQLYRSTMSALGQKLNDYWNEKCGLKFPGQANEVTNNGTLIEKSPDQSWAQCDNEDCLKWRRLPDHVNVDDLPDKWFCNMHPSIEWNRCEIPEEEEEPVDNVKPYEKKLKRIEREMRQKEVEKMKLADKQNMEIEKRRREKAEYESEQMALQMANLKKQVERMQKGQLHNAIHVPERFLDPSSFPPLDVTPQIVSVRSVSHNPSPITTSTPLNPLLSQPRRLTSLQQIPFNCQEIVSSATDTQVPTNNLQTSASRQINSAVNPPSRMNSTTSLPEKRQSTSSDEEICSALDSPATVSDVSQFTIKQENVERIGDKRLHSNLNRQSSGTKHQPISLDSESEDDQPPTKTIKTEKEVEPDKTMAQDTSSAPQNSSTDSTFLNPPVDSSTESSSSATEEIPNEETHQKVKKKTKKKNKEKKKKKKVTKTPLVKLDLKLVDFSNIDEDIVADLKESDDFTVTLLANTVTLLAKRSQCLRNLRLQVVSLVQSLVADKLKVPDVKKQSIDDKSVDEMLATLIDISNKEQDVDDDDGDNGDDDDGQKESV